MLRNIATLYKVTDNITGKSYFCENQESAEIKALYLGPSTSTIKISSKNQVPQRHGKSMFKEDCTTTRIYFIGWNYTTDNAEFLNFLKRKA